MELTLEITLTTVFWNLFTMILMKYPTLKGLRQFSMTTHLETFLPEILKEEIIQTYQAKIFTLNKEEPTYEAKKKIL